MCRKDFSSGKRKHPGRWQGGAELLAARDANKFVPTARFVMDNLIFTVGFLISPLQWAFVLK